MEATAEPSWISRRIGNDVAAVDATQHHECDGDGHHAEQPLEHRFRHELRGDPAKQTADRRGHLEDHAETQVDQLIAGAPRGHGG